MRPRAAMPGVALLATIAFNACAADALSAQSMTITEAQYGASS